MIHGFLLPYLYGKYIVYLSILISSKPIFSFSLKLDKEMSQSYQFFFTRMGKK